MKSNIHNPPPGTYNPSDTDSHEGYGSYILSNLKSFGRTKIPAISNSKTPVVGAHDGLFPRNSKLI